MNRRNFLKIGAPLGLTPLLVNGMPLRAFAAPKMLDTLCQDVEDRVLVVIHLNGANDDFNSFVPMAQYDQYAAYRPTIKIPENYLSLLDNSLPEAQSLGVHPSLGGLKSLYDNGELAVVQGVGYPLANKSHFKSQELWFKGGDGRPENYKLSEGWMARYFDYRYPSYAGVPLTEMPDPLGILIGNHIDTGFHTAEEHGVYMRLTAGDPTAYYTQIMDMDNIPLEEVPNTDQGNIMRHVLGIENSTSLYAERILNAFSSGANSSTTYTEASLAGQLKTVARLISGGLQTKIYQCNMGGFDTHGLQVDATNVIAGAHSTLLKDFSGAVLAFQEDLKALAIDQKVLTVVFSEFGRKIVENGNYGTDHGTLSNVYVIGSGVNPGVVGNCLDLSLQDTAGAPSETQLQYDYRQVFGSIMQDWLGTPDEGLTHVKFGSYTIDNKVDLIDFSNTVSPACYLYPTVTATPALLVNSHLEGFYNLTTGKMHQHLLNEKRTPLLQPYHKAPFQYYGLEEFAQLPEDFVDWVLLELRDKEDINVIISRQAAYIDINGNIRNTKQETKIEFNQVITDSYYVVLYHRNHLPVVSKDPIPLDGNAPTTLTFDETNTKGANTMKQLSNGTWVQIAGDINRDGLVDQKDINRWFRKRARIKGYRFPDVDGNSIINVADHNLVKQNNGTSSFFQQ